MLGLFGPKSGKIGVYKAAFIYQGPLKEDFSAGSPAINEVVLEEEFHEVRGSNLRARAHRKGGNTATSTRPAPISTPRSYERSEKT